MKTVIIACRSMEKELRIQLRQKNCQAPVLWMEPGLHNTPRLLKAQLQQLLQGIAPGTTVLLAMSLCGNAVAGLETGSLQLVIPRCDDCITLMLGSPERRREYADTYFLTDGWLRSEGNILWEYHRCLEKYGKERGLGIFRTMFAHYRKLAVVDTGCFDVSVLENRIQPLARALRLECITLEGTTDYLGALIAGHWQPERFLVVPPNSVVPLETCGDRW